MRELPGYACARQVGWQKGEGVMKQASEQMASAAFGGGYGEDFTCYGLVRWPLPSSGGPVSSS